MKSITLSDYVPGQPSNQMSTTTDINLVDAVEKHSFNFYLYRVDDQYVSTLELEILSGENFDRKLNNDLQVLVNEEAIKLWGITETKNAVGQKIRFWGRNWTIKGVVKNFHLSTPKSPYIPLIMRYTEQYESLATIKTNTGNFPNQMSEIKEVFENSFQDAPFEYFLAYDLLDQQYKADEDFQFVFGIFTLFALLIAGMGLFGLASFTVLKRSKEIGVRKVLGANVTQITYLLSKEFLSLIAISAFIGIPLSHLLINNWLDEFAFRIQVNWSLFIWPTLSVFFIALFSIGFETIKIAFKNPVESLRDE